MNPALVLQKAALATELDEAIQNFTKELSYIDGKYKTEVDTPERRLIDSLMDTLYPLKSQVAAIVTNAVMGGDKS